MLIIILGTMGSGKTLLCTYFALKTKTPVLTNYKIGEFKQIDEETKEFIKWKDNCRELEITELFDLPYKKCKVLLDEAYAYIESRVSMSKLNLYMSYILFQSRKRGIDIIITAQLDSTIDSRFISLADWIVYAVQCKEGFKYGIWDKKTNQIKIIEISFKLAEKIWGQYDTSEVVEPPKMEELKTQVEVMDRVKLKEKIDLLEKEFYEKNPKNIKITKAIVASFLLDNNYSDIYEEYLYPRLQKNNMKLVNG